MTQGTLFRWLRPHPGNGGSILCPTRGREYIDQGEPVSSAWLAGHSDLGLSSATVRQHSRASRGTGPRAAAAHLGRARADRFGLPAVRRCPHRRPPPRAVVARRRSPAAQGRHRSPDLLEHVSHELSRASHHIGFALAPARSTPCGFARSDFVNLDGHRRVLVVFVATERSDPDRTDDRDRSTATTTALALTHAANFHINGGILGSHPRRSADGDSRPCACMKDRVAL